MSVMVSALVVCAVVLQNNNLGSVPSTYNWSTSLAVGSLKGKYFFPAQSLPPLQAVTLGLRIKFDKISLQIRKKRLH